MKKLFIVIASLALFTVSIPWVFLLLFETAPHFYTVYYLAVSPSQAEHSEGPNIPISVRKPKEMYTVISIRGDYDIRVLTHQDVWYPGLNISVSSEGSWLPIEAIAAKPTLIVNGTWCNASISYNDDKTLLKYRISSACLSHESNGVVELKILLEESDPIKQKIEYDVKWAGIHVLFDGL